MLYELKQAPRASNKRINRFLKEIGFDKCVSEHGVHVKKDTSKTVIILCLYVDDLLIMGNNEGYTTEFKTNLMKEFEMTNIGLMTYFLGIEFHKYRKGILMHQRRYVLEILKKFEMEYYNVAINLVETRLQQSKNEDEQDIDPT